MISLVLIVWFVLALLAISLHVLGLYALLRLKRRKISDYLLIQLSFIEAAGLIHHMVFDAVDIIIKIPGLMTSGAFKSGVAIFMVSQFVAVFIITFDRVLKVKLSIR